MQKYYKSTSKRLRTGAEELLKTKKLKPGIHYSKPDNLKLIHELEVHQIELEMQNEEISLARSAEQDIAEKYIALYEYAPAGFYRLSKTGTILESNRYGSQMLDKEQSQLKNSQFGFFITDDSKPVFNLFLEQVFTSRGKESCELTLVNSGNVQMNVSVTGVAFGKGRDCQLIVVNTTKIKKAEEEIRNKNEELTRLNAEKDKFFSIIAHDLRGPFSSFLGFTTLLAEDLSSMKKDEIQEIADLLRNSANSIYFLLDNLLEWSKMQRSLTEFKPEEVPLIHVINKSLDLLSDKLTQKNQNIQLQVPESVIVKGDVVMLESIFRNLISNAVKFSQRDGIILISAKPVKGGLTEISVTDKGIGMDEVLLGKLFKINERTGRKGTDGELSSGLGLSICKDFIEKHGGKIVVESKVAEGTTFRFTLPANMYQESDSRIIINEVTAYENG